MKISKEVIAAIENAPEQPARLSKTATIDSFEVSDVRYGGKIGDNAPEFVRGQETIILEGEGACLSVLAGAFKTAAKAGKVTKNAKGEYPAFSVSAKGYNLSIIRL
jgi:hypothetical protein